MWDCAAYKFTMGGPDDVSGLATLLDEDTFRAADVVAIIAKTEGNGRVNDFSRPLAHRCFRDLLTERAALTEEELERRVAFVMSGGCEGVMSPHATVFVRKWIDRQAAGPEKRLSFAMARTRGLLPEELGTRVQVELVADAVRRAMSEAAIASPEDAHYVQVKCPLLTSDRIDDARRRGKKTVTEDTLRSMGYSNGASALGIAVGLDEVGHYEDTDICGNSELYTTRGASSSGIEILECCVFLIGNSREAVSSYVVSHHRLDDLIDGEGVRMALRAAGIDVRETVLEADRERIVNLFGKGQVPLDGRVRGRRTTLLTDSDLNTRPARAVLCAVIASIVGDPAVYASAGWGYHQGPVGGGMVAVVART